MKKTYNLFLLVVLFLFEPQNLFASDTLFVVTSKGNYLLDVSNQKLIPYDENSSLNILFSTEGLEYFTHASFATIEYQYQKKEYGTWWSMNISEKEEKYELINFDTKPEKSGYIMYPLTWSSDSCLYLFSTNGDAAGNERGIYEYNLVTKKFIERIPAFSYHKIPVVSESKKFCYFIRTDDRGQSVVCFDLVHHTETTLLAGLVISRLGIVNHNYTANYLPLCVVDLNQPEMRSPFKPATSFCVTRMGFEDVLFCDNACEYTTSLCSILPYCEGHCELGCVSCRDAVDMDFLNSNISVKTITASSDGYVIRAQTSCPVSGMGQGYGFGYHVVIRHGDQNDTNAPETLYAHLDMVYVEEGQFVFAGQHIGSMGNSQALDCDSDGVLDCDCESDENEHLHYEYHDGSGSLYSATDIFAPLFEDIGSQGCVPQPNNSYTTNFSGITIDDIYPSSSYMMVSVDVECGDNVAFVTLVGESCTCCDAAWVYEGQEYAGDTLVFPVTESMVSLSYINLYRMVHSSCISTTSATEVSSSAVLDDYFYSCLPGCVDSSACNYNSLATIDDGSCDYLCQTQCSLVDLSGDDMVTMVDVMNFMSLIGSSGPVGDFNQSGSVNISDLFIIFSFFGEICDE